MDRGELSFVEFVSDLSCQRHLPLPFGCEQFLSPIGISLDVLLDDLVSRDVDHIILDGKIGASGIDT